MSEKTFTESMQALQNAASEIGKQATTLEDSLRLFDEGMKEFINSDPTMTYISVRKSRYSHDIILRTQEFVINLMTKEIII